MPSEPRTPAPAAARGGYREHLYVPWTWWALGLVAGALLCAEVSATLAIGRVAWWWQALTVAAVAAVLVGGLLRWSLTRVEVVDGELVAGPARLPLRHVGEVRPVDDATRRQLMGPRANADAYVFVRAWVRTAVLVQVTDPADPTPYWLVSTRHPAALASVLAGGPPGAPASGAAGHYS